MADLSKLNKLFVRVNNADLRAKVIEQSKEAKNNKIYFISPTNEIITQGVAYGLSASVASEIATLKSIAKTYFADGKGTEDAIKKAVDAVQAALNGYKKSNDAAVAANKTDIESKAIKTATYNKANKTIDFATVDGKTTQSIAVSDIIGNHIVSSSSYDSTTNQLTLNFSDGKGGTTPVNIDLSSIYDLDDITTSDSTHLNAKYTAAVKDEKTGKVTKGGALQLIPVVTKIASAAAEVKEGDNVTTPAVTGLVDALDAKTYIDAKVTASQKDLQDKIDIINGKLNTIQGEDTVDGSIKKALKDAKAYTDAETTRAKGAEEKLTQDLTAETTRATGAEKTNADNITKLTETLQKEVDARKEADTKEATDRAADIKALTDALASEETFWEDFKETAQA